MSDDLERPFVPHIPFVDHSRGADDVRAECRRIAKAGADTLHARAAGMDVRKPKLTDAESAAIARKKIDEGSAR